MRVPSGSFGLDSQFSMRCAVSSRWLSVVLLVLLSLLPAGVVQGASCWQAPVQAPISDPFREPACRWCAGNRGIEYRTRPGASLRAVATGRVTFAGTIAGTTYLVVRHADGIRATYGNVDDLRFSNGDLVVRRSIVGTASDVFHFGVRDGDRYLDPARFIGRYVYRTRLLPTSGEMAARAPRPVLRCSG
jgi:murein DD-endopeptidase MepM/ murein hydrolase activator NlpD